MSEKKTKKRDRSRNKKVRIVGSSVEINGKVYGASAMQTNYESSMALPDKEKAQAICAEAYMKLLALFTGIPKEPQSLHPKEPQSLQGKGEWIEEYNTDGIVIESNTVSGEVRLFLSEENTESFNKGIVVFDEQGRGYGDIEPYIPYRKI